MGRISQYKREVPRIVLTDLPNLPGESITCTQSLPLGFVKWLTQAIPESLDDTGQRMDLSIADYARLVEGFCDYAIVDWSFTDDADQPLPVNADNLAVLDPRDILAIIDLYLEAVFSPLPASPDTGGQ